MTRRQRLIIDLQTMLRQEVEVWRCVRVEKMMRDIVNKEFDRKTVTYSQRGKNDKG